MHNTHDIMQPPAMTTEDYDTAVKKGSHLLEMVLSSSNTTQHSVLPADIPQSEFIALEDLSRYGYTYKLTAWKNGDTILKRLATALQALNVNADLIVDGGNNAMIEHQHLKDCTFDGVFYPVRYY